MWTESRRRLPTYLLVGGSGPNVVHACKFFFFLINFFFFFFFFNFEFLERGRKRGEGVYICGNKLSSEGRWSKLKSGRKQVFQEIRDLLALAFSLINSFFFFFFFHSLMGARLYQLRINQKCSFYILKSIEIKTRKMFY